MSPLSILINLVLDTFLTIAFRAISWLGDVVFIADMVVNGVVRDSAAVKDSGCSCVVIEVEFLITMLFNFSLYSCLLIFVGLLFSMAARRGVTLFGEKQMALMVLFSVWSSQVV